MSRLICPDCERPYSGSDRSGGHCMACHLSFSSQGGFDKHRTGPHNPRGLRRCMTPEEMTGKGWTVSDEGMVRLPAAPERTWGR